METITEYLCLQNREFKDQKPKVITCKKMTNNKISYILEISPKLLRDIKELKTVSIDWDQCPFKEIWHINRCGKCLEFNHYTKECPNKLKCHKCGGDHPTKECQNKKKECCICSNHNKKYNNKLNTEHSALNENKCRTLINKIRHQKNITEYSVKEEPEIQIEMDTI